VEFTLQRTEEPVIIDGESYVLIEPTEADAKTYRNAVLRSQRMDAETKTITSEGMADVPSILVACCLFKADLDGSKRSPVAQKTILTWPTKVIKALFQKAQDMGDLNELPETKEDLEKVIKKCSDRIARLEAAKNSQSDAT
jgi:hypothetical protein